ncbi:type III polyketide synthase [Schlesneria paludicola]|uniref:type III polyketide synthase n=1 Tax=Schlesneria paludicola TaxID=360056 RepID=UPI00029AA4F6|nr:type III polyketide synthase [Schlesneria paludicola]
MHVAIAGIGTAVPDHQCEQEEAGEVAAQYCSATPEQAHMLSVLYRMSGVNTRGSVVLESADGILTDRQEFFPPCTPESPNGPTTEARLNIYAEKAGPLALTASKRALEQSETSPQAITHLITVTCSGFVAPGFDFTLIKQLPLRSDVARTQIGFMGCHAALNALRVARAFVAADPTAVVLVCCVELCTLHYQYGWNPEQIVANSLFADGAAACVIRAEIPAVTGSVLESQQRPISRILASGSTLLPDSEDAMTWRVGDHGFRMTLSTRVPGLLEAHLRPWLTSWLKQYDLRPEEISTWAAHPGGPKILNAFADTMSIPREQLSVSREIMQTHGNMSSPTVLFVLDRLRSKQASGPCVAIGFGPGLVAEATLLA